MTDLAAILAELQALRRDVAELRAFVGMDRDIELVSGLVAIFGGKAGQFLAQELEDAEGLPAQLAGKGSRAIAKRLAQIEGRPVAGWRIVRCGMEANSTLWGFEKAISPKAMD